VSLGLGRNGYLEAKTKKSSKENGNHPPNISMLVSVFLLAGAQTSQPS